MATRLNTKMTRTGLRKKTHKAVLFVCLFLFGSALSISALDINRSWRKDLDHEERLEVAELIRSLDTSAIERAEAVQKLAELGRGRNAELVQEQLIAALSYKNPQIRQGVCEVMIHIGDASIYLSPLANAMVYETQHDVRLQMIRSLAGFLISDEATRLEAVSLLDADNYGMTERLNNLLRTPPLKSGTFEEDPRRIRIRKTVISALAGQLDPIGTAIEGLKIKSRQVLALNVIGQLVFDHMGDDYETASNLWRTIRPNARLQDKAFVESVEQAAARLLSDIGAVECAPELYALGQVERPAAQASAMHALAELAGLAQKLWAKDELRLGNTSEKAMESERVWRRFRQNNCEKAVTFAYKLGVELISQENVPEIVRSSIFAALGHSRSPKAVEILLKWVIQHDDSFADRPGICLALGEIGGKEAARALAQMASYKGYGETSSLRQDEYRAVLVAMKALSDIAMRPGDPGGMAALNELCMLVLDRRTIEGRPPLGDQALFLLQAGFGSTSKSTDPNYWERQRKAKLATMEQKRLSLNFEKALASIEKFQKSN